MANATSRMERRRTKITKWSTRKYGISSIVSMAVKKSDANLSQCLQRSPQGLTISWRYSCVASRSSPSPRSSTSLSLLKMKSTAVVVTLSRSWLAGYVRRRNSIRSQIERQRILLIRVDCGKWRVMKHFKIYLTPLIQVIYRSMHQVASSKTINRSRMSTSQMASRSSSSGRLHSRRTLKHHLHTSHSRMLREIPLASRATFQSSSRRLKILTSCWDSRFQHCWMTRVSGLDAV